MFIDPIVDFEDKSLKNYFFSTHQSMWITDTDFQSFLEINEAAANAYGYSREEIFLQPVEKIIPQKEQSKLLKLASDAKSEQNQIKKEISLINRAGKTVYAEIIVSAIFHDNKEARLFTLTDISEKKLYRTLLEELIDEEIDLKNKNRKLENAVYTSFHRARKPLANILGLVNLITTSKNSDKTLTEAIAFLKESGNELDQLITGIDPQLINERL